MPYRTVTRKLGLGSGLTTSFKERCRLDNKSVFRLNMGDDKLALNALSPKNAGLGNIQW